MPLNKATQKKVEVGKDVEYKKELLELFKKKFEGVDLSKLEFPEIMGPMQYRENAAELLKVAGKLKESNALREENANIMLSRSLESERNLFDLYQSIGGQEAQAQSESIKKQLSLMNAQFGELIKQGTPRDDPVLKELQAAGIQLTQVYQQIQMGQKQVEQLAQEALSYTVGAMTSFVALDKFEEMFNLSHSTALKYRDVGLTNLALQLSQNSLNLSQQRFAELTHKEGRSEDAKKLAELCIDYALKMAPDFEKESPEQSLEFLKLAAKISSEIGDYARAHKIVGEAIKDFKAKGLEEFQIEMLEFGITISNTEKEVLKQAAR